MSNPVVVEGFSLPERRERGAFFTPPSITHFLSSWAIRDKADAKVLDPTCGDGAFLIPAATMLRELGATSRDVASQVRGLDIHEPSLRAAENTLQLNGLAATLQLVDFFEATPPQDSSGAWNAGFDAVIGNPPFIRYQQHKGASRKRAAEAALRAGVRLSGLASSWAPALVHSSAFLKPEGRLAMVLPAELLTVGYAEPVRDWLRRRFSSVTLVVIERLEFAGAQERVLLLLAQGTGGCDGFSLVYVDEAAELEDLRLGDGTSVTAPVSGKWTELLLPRDQLRIFRDLSAESFRPLSSYGRVMLGTVTGANDYFVLSEPMRRVHGLSESQLRRVCPPGSRHIRGLCFTARHWENLRDAGERVWLLWPQPDDTSDALTRYVAVGESLGVHDAYKCRVRTPWWRPPLVETPDLFFAYMSHHYPRLSTNSADASFVNSMHGVLLRADAPAVARRALPLLALNSVTLLGAELNGRSYGGGVLKLEPGEAVRLPLPTPAALEKAWERLKPEYDRLNRQLMDGRWTNVAKRVDEVLLREVLQVPPAQVSALHEATTLLRSRRLS